MVVRSRVLDRPAGDERRIERARRPPARVPAASARAPGAAPPSTWRFGFTRTSRTCCRTVRAPGARSSHGLRGWRAGRPGGPRRPPARPLSTTAGAAIARCRRRRGEAVGMPSTSTSRSMAPSWDKRKRRPPRAVRAPAGRRSARAEKRRPSVSRGSSPGRPAAHAGRSARPERAAHVAAHVPAHLRAAAAAVAKKRALLDGELLVVGVDGLGRGPPRARREAGARRWQPGGPASPRPPRHGAPRGGRAGRAGSPVARPADREPVSIRARRSRPSASSRSRPWAITLASIESNSGAIRSPSTKPESTRTPGPAAGGAAR
jgi:hypothetical protein